MLAALRSGQRSRGRGSVQGLGRRVRLAARQSCPPSSPWQSTPRYRWCQQPGPLRRGALRWSPNSRWSA